MTVVASKSNVTLGTLRNTCNEHGRDAVAVVGVVEIETVSTTGNSGEAARGGHDPA
jgi:hypothetical protein